MEENPDKATDSQTNSSPVGANEARPKKAAKKKSPSRKGKSKKLASSKSTPNSGKPRRSGGPARSFPGVTFESVLSIAQIIFEHAGASREMKRTTVFNLLGKSAESGPSRMLVTNSSRYGLTIGGYQAEDLKLTDLAISILEPTVPQAEKITAKFTLAIKGIAPFYSLYEKFKGGRLPALEVMKDSLKEVNQHDRQDCVDVFVGNAKYVGLLKVTSGAEWMLDLSVPVAESGFSDGIAGGFELGTIPDGKLNGNSSGATDFDSICFFMAPIGSDGSTERKHSDLVLESLVIHALKSFNLTVVRADQISAPGMISRQIIEYILKSRLAIVDLSFHNPNVFYELAIRHMLGKPTVHLIKKSDGIPFDVGNFRTIYIDDRDMYELIAKLETYRVEIANFAREALDGSSAADNPILAFFPGIQVTLT